MVATNYPWVLPSVPPLARLGILGVFIGVLFYVPNLFQPAPPPAEAIAAAEPTIVVPTLDRDVLATAKDATREQRLLFETEPLRHLLGQAINVVPSVAVALGMPEQPVPLATLRANPEEWRGRWLWYRGELEELTGPREGHPVKGYSIYEATVKLAGDDRVLATFSLPPGSEVHRGGIVRVEGYLMKLRDTTYPSNITGAPMLVGRLIQRDYEEWPPVSSLDPNVYSGLDESCYPGTKAWHTIAEDQGVPLWHIAAFVRGTANLRTFAEWRQIGTLNANETYPILQADKLARGTPLRILGTLVKVNTIAADPNPAGIKFWTVAYVQVRDFGGRLIPIWVPKQLENVPLWSGLEVRAHYYRWFAYEGLQGDRFRVPLFVAADLQPFQLDAGRTMRELGVAIGSLATAMMLLFWWSQRRSSKNSVLHGQQMDERRRRRRERSKQATDSVPSQPST